MYRVFKQVVLACFVAVCGTSIPGAWAAQPGGNLTVELSGLAGASGKVFIAVYDSSDTWLSDDVVMSQEVEIAAALDGEIVRTQLLLPPGDYALSLFYDRNGNGKLDTNFIGIPKEPIALSNNAKAKFGPPKYTDAVFTLGAGAGIQSIAMEEI